MEQETTTTTPTGLSYLLQTPTLTLTGIGVIASIAHALRVPHAGSVAVVSLGLCGIGGTAITFTAAVEQTHTRWGWRGVARAIRSPSPLLLRGLLGHLPQLIIAILIWRASKKKG